MDNQKNSMLITDDVKSQLEYEAIPNGRVLVVDNRNMSLYIAQRMLSIYGLLIDIAKSGHEAIEKIKYNAYDLVLMDHDHMMPEMDGMKTTRKIRRLKGGYKKLPIVALATNTAAGMKEVFLANGYSGFIPKPFVLQDMDKTLKEWLPLEKISRRARAEAADIEREAYNRFVERIKHLKEKEQEPAAEARGIASTMRGSPLEDTEQLRENMEKALTAA